MDGLSSLNDFYLVSSFIFLIFFSPFYSFSRPFLALIKKTTFRRIDKPHRASFLGQWYHVFHRFYQFHRKSTASSRVTPLSFFSLGFLELGDMVPVERGPLNSLSFRDRTLGAAVRPSRRRSALCKSYQGILINFFPPFTENCWWLPGNNVIQ